MICREGMSSNVLAPKSVVVARQPSSKSKATRVVAVKIVFSPTGGDVSYLQRGMCVAKGSLERGLLWEL